MPRWITIRPLTDPGSQLQAAAVLITTKTGKSHLQQLHTQNHRHRRLRITQLQLIALMQAALLPRAIMPMLMPFTMATVHLHMLHVPTSAILHKRTQSHRRH